jgi:DNA invertase Pin-like site-specific DNA recombinase
MEFVREGDELVVLKLDRLGRNTRDVLNLVHDLRQKGAVLSAEASFEFSDHPENRHQDGTGDIRRRELRLKDGRERQKAGIARAKANGVYKGRKPTVPVERVRAMHRDALVRAP